MLRNPCFFMLTNIFRKEIALFSALFGRFSCRIRFFAVHLHSQTLRCVTASTKGEKMIQAPTLMKNVGYFYAYIVRWREAVSGSSLMRNKYGGCLPRVLALRVQRT